MSFDALPPLEILRQPDGSVLPQKLFNRAATAREVRDFAMASLENYRAMAEVEQQVWGGLQTSKKRRKLRNKEMKASLKLELHRHAFRMLPWFKQRGLRFTHGLSIGCGEGRAERRFVKLGICERFHGVDIARESVAAAKEENAQAGMHNTYEVVDANFADFGENRFDFVLAQTSLHHIVHLENVFAAIHRCLKPGGIFFMHDFVGESQFQHSPERIARAAEVLEIIPERFKLNRNNQRSVDPIRVPEPGTLVSPFESIRSGEILDIADHHFERLAGSSTSSLIHLVLPSGTRGHYAKDDAGRALFSRIIARDQELIESGELSGTDARIIFRAR